MIMIFINETENVKQIFFQKWPEYVTAILTFVKPKSTEFDPSGTFSRPNILATNCAFNLQILILKRVQP